MIVEMSAFEDELASLGMSRFSITTSGDPRKNSSSSGDLAGITGQPISSLQRAIRNTIIGGVKSSISLHSNAEEEESPGLPKRSSDSNQSPDLQ